MGDIENPAGGRKGTGVNKPLAKRIIKELPEELIQAIRDDIKRDEYRFDAEIAQGHGVLPAVVAYIRESEAMKPMTMYRKRQGDVMKHLREHPEMTDVDIAKLYRCTGTTVAKYRREMGIAPARRGIQQVSDNTIKARQMLTDNPTVTDLEVARACGISFAHVARQRDILGIPRSARNNRRPSPRLSHDYTAIDADIRAGEMSMLLISQVHGIPVKWVKMRANEIGVQRRRSLSPDEHAKIEEMLRQGSPRMTCKQIASIMNCSITTIDRIRKEIGLRRLPPGHMKWEERRKAREMLSSPNRPAITVIARECGLSVTTVSKMMKDAGGERWGV